METLIRKARKDAGLSLKEAANQLDISEGYLSQIENGLRQVGANRAERIATLYKIEREEIFLPSRYALREVPGKGSEKEVG